MTKSLRLAVVHRLYLTC